jgi:hypothetical protein
MVITYTRKRETLLIKHTVTYCNLNNSGGNLVALAELGLILMNFRTAAQEACINDLELMDNCILRCDAIYSYGTEGQQQSMKYWLASQAIQSSKFTKLCHTERL